MADTPPAPSSGTTTPPSSAAEQARIRKERREAKIRAGGSARLNKITGLGGGIQRDPPPQPAVIERKVHADPDEVDISEHFYAPNTTARIPPSNNGASSPSARAMNDDALRQLMLGFDPSTPNSGTPPPGANPFNPFAGLPGMEGFGGPGQGTPGQDDPMMKLLQQMMGGAAGGGGGEGGMPSFPGMPGQQATPNAAEADPYAYLWRIVHAVFALSLGLYIAFTTPFTGTKVERERSALGSSIAGVDGAPLTASSIHFFYIFATAEVMLQSSRFWFEKGRVQPGGILGTIMGFLPQPWSGYLALVLRYSRIWTTVSGDAMVLVFVLGVCVWLRGDVA